MIKIYKADEAQLLPSGWDFSTNEIDYLLEEHNGESFVLKDNRLYEALED